MDAKKILIIGGAGYVGSALVPKLLVGGHYVRVLDTFWFGKTVFNDVAHYYDPDQSYVKLEVCEGDMRDTRLVSQMMEGMDVVIHLACISNDPSFDLNPELGRSINLDAFLGLIEVLKKVRPKYFIYASTSSVYGIKEEKNVTEKLSLEPLTDYSKYKALCEFSLKGFLPTALVPWVIIRPATVCGWSPRLRLDLTVNILTANAYFKKKIKVFGGSQKRPNIHIDDMTDLYVDLAEKCDVRIAGQVFNAGWENFTLLEIANMVRRVVGLDIGIEIVPTDDIRSYHISSGKIKREFGWQPQRTVEDAIRDLVGAFKAGKVENPDDDIYYNIKTMKKLGLA